MSPGFRNLVAKVLSHTGKPPPAGGTLEIVGNPVNDDDDDFVYIT